ncbi:MAG TPA: PASTA domain-containing protein [Vicinamibacterales bacterium]|jgi:serine/threonine-protein kinase|nr:PASTA domain-containing protein [Vicinamibacterales bacterium]
MALKTRVWTVGKLMLLALALGATFFLFAMGAMRVALRTREVQVPDLTGRTTNEATAITGNLGLALKVDESRRPDPKMPAGRVVAQEPSAGSVSRTQRTLRVWLSAGVRAATVPRLIGETERAAQLRIQQDGLLLTATSEIRSQDMPTDVVVAQNPPERSAAGQVALLINRGERGASYVMPDLIGVNGDRAADVLRNHGFRVAVVGSQPYPGVAAGIVIRQSPQAGFQIAPGEPISLEVSR